MAGAVSLIAALKKRLKACGMTYRDVAPVLGLSEASVKRLFSTGNFTLERIERVCGALDISLGDLVRDAEAAAPGLRSLAAGQERELVSDPKLMMVAVLAVEGWSFGQILANYSFTKPELVRALARLDRLRLIELLPGNRIKRLAAANFRWIENGPIERFFSHKVKGAFLHSRFDGPAESLRFVYGMLSQRSLAVVQRRLEQVAHEFDELHREDQRMALEERRGCSLLLAMRPWDFFADYRRSSE